MGKLRLCANAGKKLKKLEMGILSKQDPYVVFGSGTQSGKTATDENSGAEPKWKDKRLKNEVIFNIKDASDSQVRMQVMNDNGNKAHKLIGEGSIDVAAFFENPNSPVELEVKLKNNGKDAGTLLITVEYLEEQKQEKTTEPALKNQIVVTALRAENLKNLQVLMKQDPYVKVSLETVSGEVVASAQTLASKGTKPSWDESKNNVLILGFQKQSPVKIVFEVWEEEGMRKDRIIASCVKPITDFGEKGEIAISLADPKGKTAGTLYATIEIPASLLTKFPVQTAASSHDDIVTAKSAKKEFQAGTITLTAVEGIQLKNVQTFGEQDPFVKATLLPWNIISNPEKTKNSNGVNPKWSSKNSLEISFPGDPGVGQLPQLFIEVMDDEMMRKARLIGNATIDITEFVTQGDVRLPLSIKLQDKKYRQAGELKTTIEFKIGPVGKSEEKIELMKEPGIITITAQSAVLTRSVEMIGKQDPYVQVVLKPWAGEMQQGRTVSKDGAGKEPVWTEGNVMELYYPGGETPTGEMPELVVQVMDAQTISDRIIGYGTVKLAAILTRLAKGDEIDHQVELVYEKKKDTLKACGTCNISFKFRKGNMESMVKMEDKGFSLNVKPDFERTEPLEIYATICKGSNLKNRAWFGKQDPFVKCTLQPWGSYSSTQPISDGGTNVEWTSQQGNVLKFKYPGARNDEFATLLVECWDSQVGGDRLIGSRIINEVCLLQSETNAKEMTLPLIAKDGKSVDKHPGGDLSLTIHARKRTGNPITRCGVLIVHLESSTMTKSGDWFSKSDPYLRFRMTPGVVPTKCVESVVLNNTGDAAEFNETLEIPIFDFGMNGVGSNGEYQSLIVEVLDRDTFTADDSLGKGLADIAQVLSQDYDPTLSHEVTLTHKRKDVGSVYSKLEFKPSKYAGNNLLNGMKIGEGSIRVWFLEARELKHVGGMLDSKQDPYARVVWQRPNEPTPGRVKKWPSSQKTPVHNDAGSACVWNAYIDIPFDQSDSSYVNSGTNPGVLHVAVLDQGTVSDTVIGTCSVNMGELALTKAGDDIWVTLSNEDGKKCGQVRIALEFFPGPPKSEMSVAMKDDFCFVEAGSLHLLVTGVSGIPPSKAKTVSGEIVCGKFTSKLPKMETDVSGFVTWNTVIEIPWNPQPLNPTTEPVMQIPTISIHMSGNSGSAFGVNHSIGSCAIPIASFVPLNMTTESYERQMIVCQGTSFSDTFATLRVVGTFSRHTGEVSGSKKDLATPVKQAASGRLHVRILAGKNLKNRELLGKQDPLVKLLMQPCGDFHQTDTCTDGGKTPKWTDSMNNSHVFLVEDANSAMVHLTCEDEDTVSNDLIGKVSIPVLSIYKQGKIKGSDNDVHSQLLEKTAENQDQLSTAQVASSAIFRTKKWEAFCEKSFKVYGGGDASPASKPYNRLDLLTEFYRDIKKRGNAEIDDVQEKARIAHEKFPDNEPQNKKLFGKLFKKYHPGESCPERFWKLPSEKHQGDEVDIDLFQDLLDFIEPRSDEFFPGDSNVSLSQSQVKNLVSLYPKYLKHLEGKVIGISEFESISKVVVSQMIYNAVAKGVRFDGHSEEGETGGSKLWWTLTDSKGKSAGKIQVEAWFTEDWSPVSRSAQPELLQQGVLWVQIQSATFTTDKDLFGKQDPYIAVKWNNSESSEQKTKSKSNAPLHVEWEGDDGLLKLDYSPQLAFEAQQIGQTPSLVIQARDKDVVGSQLIGETKVPLIYFAKNPGSVFAREVPLINTARGETTRAGTIQIRIQFVLGGEGTPNSFDSTDLKPAPSAISGRLILDVKSARNLKDVQWIGSMEPVASLRLWPENESSRTKAAVNAEKNPSWNETHTFDSMDGDMALFELDISTGKTNIGMFQIALCNILSSMSNGGEYEDWFQLVQLKNGKVTRSGQVCLSFKFEMDGEDDGSSASAGGALCYIPGPGTIHIKVRKAADLRNQSKQDPFVAITGLNFRKSFSTKTNVDENGGSNPVFEFSASAQLQWGPKDKQVPLLELAVKDRNLLMNTAINTVTLNLSPWLFGPGQIASMWIPTYSQGSGGPYAYKPKQGALLVDLQYIPKAEFPGKPASAFSRSSMKRIAEPVEERNGDIHVQIIACRNLTDVQALGKQDPYVKVTRIAGGTKLDGVLDFIVAKTSVQDNGGSNPEWNEDILISYDEKALGLETGSIPIVLVEVWDSNIKLQGDKLIGKTILPVFPCVLDDRQVLDSWYPLTNSSNEKAGEIHLGMQYRRQGEVKQDIPSEAPENILNVVVIRARNLHNVGDGIMGGAQDPFVQVEFVGHDKIYKTQVANEQGTDPVFEERLQVFGCMPDSRGSFPRLRCQIFDHDTGGNTFIGMFEFSLTSSIMRSDSVPHEQWFQLTDKDLSTSRGELQVIMKRGPFPGDIDDGLANKQGDGKLLVSLLKLHQLTDSHGKTPLKPIFRASCFVGETEFSKGDFVDNVIIPIKKKQTENDPAMAISISAMQKKWTIRGLRPIIIASASVPKAQKLIDTTGPVNYTLSLVENDLELGKMDVEVQYLPSIAGQLRINVVSVSNIKKQEWFGKNDLRVVLQISNGDSKLPPEETSTKTGAGDASTFNETVNLLYSNQNETRRPQIHVKVIDVDSMSQNDLCGEVFISILDLILDAMKQGVAGAIAKIPAKEYSLIQGGLVTLGIEFSPNSNVFKQKVVEETKQVMELKRMWNMIDINHDGRLTKEELIGGLKSVPGCAAFLGLGDESLSDMDAINSLFDEMNSNDDDIVDFQEFSSYIESKPAREKLKKQKVQMERAKARDAYAADNRRTEERDQAIRLKRLEREREELDAKRQMEEEEQLKRLAKIKQREELSKLRRREEELARLAEQKEMAKLAQEELKRQEKEDRVKKKKDRVEHKRPDDVLLWRTKDVVEWLAHDLELPEYAVVFAEGGVDGPLLVELTEEDLIEGLGMKNPMHRRKVLTRAGRLIQIRNEVRQPKTANPVGNRTKKGNSSGDRTLLQMKLAQQAKLDQQKRDQVDNAPRKQIFPFEYTSPIRNQTQPEEEDWYDKLAMNNDSVISSSSSDDESDGEAGFQTAMANVRERILKSHKKTTMKENPPRLSTNQENRDNNIGPVENIDPDMNGHQLLDLLKNKIHQFGNYLKKHRRIPQDQILPEIFKMFTAGDFSISKMKFQAGLGPILRLVLSRTQFSELFSILAGSGSSIDFDTFELISSTTMDSSKTIPEGATVEEIILVIGQAIYKLGDGQDKTALSKVYHKFLELRNNRDERTSKLSRLKFEGGIKTLLHVDLTWVQFDRLFRKISSGKADSGTIEFDEFYNAFSTSNSNSGSMRKILFAVCSTLVKSKVTLKEAFQGFDRNGNGEISTAEFASMMRQLSNDLTKKDIYSIMRCIDSDYNTVITYSEFLQFWLVVFTQWLDHLKTRRNRDKTLINRVTKMMQLTFGKKILEHTPPLGALSDLLGQVGSSTPAATHRSALLDRVGTNSNLNSSGFYDQYISQARSSIDDILSSSAVYDDDMFGDKSPRGTALEAVRAARKRHDEHSSMLREKERTSSRGTYAPPVADINSQFSFRGMP